MAKSTSSESVVGLAFPTPGKFRLTQRAGVVLRVDGAMATLHVSPKDKGTIEVPVDSLGESLDAIPVELSPATRLRVAIRQPYGPIKSSWDISTLEIRADELAAESEGAMRRAFDEAIEFGWTEVIDSSPLTESEKAWRLAHHAAEVGDLDQLTAALKRLPPTGYHSRVDLILPLLTTAVDHAECLAELARWRDHGLPNADALLDLVQGEWAVALGSGIDMLSRLTPSRSEAWSSVLAEFKAAAPRAAIAPDSPDWDAAAVVTSGDAGANVDEALNRIAHLPASILDDLIDSGALTPEASFDSIDTLDHTYLLARLRPQEIDDTAAKAAGHYAELARRYYRRADRDALGSLPPSLDVRHFQALLDVHDGTPPDADRLYPDVVKALMLVDSAQNAIENARADSLPDPILRDPTLWGFFAQYAQTGQLAPDADLRVTTPGFAEWCDLQRLLGLLWEEDWNDAVILGKALLGSLTQERQELEALNLTAFAHLGLGDTDDAIRLLEKAVDGPHRENLLINLSIALSQGNPAAAAGLFARILNETSSHELKVAAMRRAVGVWDSAAPDPAFPDELVGPLTTLLTSDLLLEDYAQFSALAATFIPGIYLQLPTATGAYAPVNQLLRARARFTEDPGFLFGDLASEFVAVHQQVGRPSWFNAEWKQLVESVRTSVFSPFGEAAGTAELIQTFMSRSPDLFSQEERFIFAPQAGAHLAAHYAESGTALKPELIQMLFYRPIEEFLAERSLLDRTQADAIADNFHLTLCLAAGYYLDTMRSGAAEVYNELVSRLNWDYQNRLAIVSQMRSVLDESARHQEEVDRAVDRLQRLAVDSTEGRKRLAPLTDALSEWRSETITLRSNL